MLLISLRSCTLPLPHTGGSSGAVVHRCFSGKRFLILHGSLTGPHRAGPGGADLFYHMKNPFTKQNVYFCFKGTCVTDTYGWICFMILEFPFYTMVYLHGCSQIMFSVFWTKRKCIKNPLGSDLQSAEELLQLLSCCGGPCRCLQHVLQSLHLPDFLKN